MCFVAQQKGMVIYMKMYTVPQELSAYLDKHFTCDCGLEHYAPLKAVSIRGGALYDLPRHLQLERIMLT